MRVPKHLVDFVHYQRAVVALLVVGCGANATNEAGLGGRGGPGGDSTRPTSAGSSVTDDRQLAGDGPNQVAASEDPVAGAGDSAAGDTTGLTNPSVPAASSADEDGSSSAAGMAAEDSDDSVDLAPSTNDDVDVPPVPTEPEPEPECVAPEVASSEEVVRRLQRLLWDTEEQAPVGELPTGEPPSPNAVRTLAKEMLSDPDYGRVGLTEFVRSWLWLGDVERLDMPEALLASTLESTNRTLEYLLFEPGAPLSALYSGDEAVVDAELAAFYEVPPPATGWGVVQLPEARRAGFFGQAFWLNAHSHPAMRGAVILETLRCFEVPFPPADAVLVEREPSSSESTRREQYLASVADPVCAGCHSIIAPLGLAFEHFDGWGTYRTFDNGFVVDASGGIPQTEIEVDGARELAAAFAGELRSETHACAARKAVARSLGEGPWSSTAFDEPTCFAELNPELAELEDPLFYDWVVQLVGSPIFLAQYSSP